MAVGVLVSDSNEMGVSVKGSKSLLTVEVIACTTDGGARSSVVIVNVSCTTSFSFVGSAIVVGCWDGKQDAKQRIRSTNVVKVLLYLLNNSW